MAFPSGLPIRNRSNFRSDSLTENYFSKELPQHMEYMKSYHVCKCVQNCGETNCLNCHNGQALRRAVFLVAEGKWNYNAKLCTNPPPCKLGEKCRYCHSKEEYAFHPLVYKRKECKYGANASGVCHRWGMTCSYYHSENDRRASQTMEFSLETFKTEPCTNNRCTELDCLKYHSQAERRRNPYVVEYSYKRCSYKGFENCPNKDSCLFSHTKFEVHYHPDFYKTKECKISTCSSKFCAFRHSESKIFEEFQKSAEENSMKALETKESEGKKSEDKHSTDDTSHEIFNKEEEKGERECEEKLQCKNCKEKEIEWVFECGMVCCGNCLGKVCVKCNRNHLTRLL